MHLRILHYTNLNRLLAQNHRFSNISLVSFFYIPFPYTYLVGTIFNHDYEYQNIFIPPQIKPRNERALDFLVLLFLSAAENIVRRKRQDFSQSRRFKYTFWYRTSKNIRCIHQKLIYIFLGFLLRLTLSRPPTLFSSHSRIISTMPRGGCKLSYVTEERRVSSASGFPRSITTS